MEHQRLARRESAEDGTSDNLAFGNTITRLHWRLWDVESTHKLFIEAGEDVRGCRKRWGACKY